MAVLGHYPVRQSHGTERHQPSVGQNRLL